MPHSIRIEARALKQLRRLDAKVRADVKDAIDDLATNPKPLSSGTMNGAAYRGLRKLRVGDWRVIYRIIDVEIVVSVIAIGHRSDVYKS